MRAARCGSILDALGCSNAHRARRHRVRDGRARRIAVASGDAGGARHYTCYVPTFIGFAHILRRLFVELTAIASRFISRGKRRITACACSTRAFDIIYMPSARVVHARSARTAASRSTCANTIRNDCLFAALQRAAAAGFDGAVRLGRYLSMSRRIRRPGGFAWIRARARTAIAVVIGGRQPCRGQPFVSGGASAVRGPPFRRAQEHRFSVARVGFDRREETRVTGRRRLLTSHIPTASR